MSAALERVARGGRYLVFGLGDEEYGIDVLRVREIIGPLPITRVPRVPETVRGVINLRGRIIPVVDLRIRFGLAAVDHGARTTMIVVQTAHTEFAAVVDRMCEVATFADDDIEDAPAFGGAISTDFLLGIVRAGERVRLLLDVDRAVSQQELAVPAAALQREPAVPAAASQREPAMASGSSRQESAGAAPSSQQPDATA